MSAVLKINVAVWGAVLAVAISGGGVLMGVGVFHANQAIHRVDIDKNEAAIESLKGEIRGELNRIQDQMRQDKAELLTAIRANP